MKIMQRNEILKDSLIILRKSMVAWENQLNQGAGSGHEKIADLLSQNAKDIKNLVILLGIDASLRKMNLSSSEMEKKDSEVQYAFA